MNKKDTTIDIPQTKVKVYYSFKESKSTRLASFQIPGLQYDHNTTSTAVNIPLKKCLWAICSSSPDMICPEHDISVYSANCQESENTNHVDKTNNLIWEGHGLMSWVMDDQHGDEILVSGKFNQQHIEVCMQLQPTLKWRKSEFYNALQSQGYDGLRPDTPTKSVCNCGIYAAICTQQQQQDEWKRENDMKRKRQTSPLSPSSMTSPTLPSLSSATSSSLPTHLPPPATIASPPASLFRPEPILPSAETYLQSLPSQNTLPFLDERKHRYYPTSVNSPSPPSPLSSSSLSSSSSSRNTHQDHLPYPLPEPSSRSAFTPTSTYNNHSPLSVKHQLHELIPPAIGTTSVVYAPCNKKRRKNPPVIMPADSNKYLTGLHQKDQQQQKQQVCTTVRTYYEVDRDNHGQYILPVEIDSWTVVDLGTVVYDRPAYHNQRYIYPVNYTVRKWYRSMVDPKSDTQYTCRILDNGREPKFEVTADDCPITYSGFTPSTVWTIVVRRAFALRNIDYNHNPVGPDFFGLRKNTIAKMIQDLPNVDKCLQYIRQTFEPARFNKPGRNRRRLDTMVSGSILGGVNYSLTSGRLNTVASQQQLQQQLQQRRSSPVMGITGTIDPNESTESSKMENPSQRRGIPQVTPITTSHYPYHRYSNHASVTSSQSYTQSSSYHAVPPTAAPIKTI